MTLGSHQRTVGKSQVHLTPRWLLDALGRPFDLDPCAATVRPWDCARTNFVEADDGLSREWFGEVWLNPPFHRYQVAEWISRLAEHGNGITLVHARTEAAWFEPIWRHATLLLFLADRIKFCLPDGVEQPANSGAPVVLAAFGSSARSRLFNCGIPGVLVGNWITQFEAQASDNSPAGTPSAAPRAGAVRGSRGLSVRTSHAERNTL